MKRPTEAQAARIEARIELLRYSSRPAERREAARLQIEYWNACNLSPDVRAQLEDRDMVRL
jgi:hypothetical protein